MAYPVKDLSSLDRLSNIANTAVSLKSRNDAQLLQQQQDIARRAQAMNAIQSYSSEPDEQKRGLLAARMQLSGVDPTIFTPIEQGIKNRELQAKRSALNDLLVKGKPSVETSIGTTGVNYGIPQTTTKYTPLDIREQMQAVNSSGLLQPEEIAKNNIEIAKLSDPKLNISEQEIVGANGKPQRVQVVTDEKQVGNSGYKPKIIPIGETFVKPSMTDSSGLSIDPKLLNLTGKQLLDELKKIDPLLAKDVENIATYKQNISVFPTRMYGKGGGKKQYTQQDIAALANIYDPSYQGSNYNVVSGTNSEYTKGVTGRNVVALNTAMKHLNQMNDLAYNLQNENNQGVNYAKNKIKEWFGSSVPTNVETLAPMVSSEVAKMLAGAGVTNQEQVNAVRQMFSTAKSYNQLADGIREALKLTKGRAEEVRSGYDRGLGNVSGYRVVSPDNAKLFKKFGIDYSEGGLDNSSTGGKIQTKQGNYTIEEVQ